MILRLSKIALLAAVAFFYTLVVINNLTDYQSNFNFVLHVLSMDTTFPGNELMYRSISHPTVHHLFYASIILWEAIVGVVLWVAVVGLSKVRSAPREVFQARKSLAAVGLTLGLLLWFIAFITVGGEWFAMWQSEIWNGQDAAFRMFTCMGIIILFVMQPERD